MKRLNTLSLFLFAATIFISQSTFAASSSAVLMAAGEDLTGDAPLLVVSNDGGGQNWVVKSIAGLPSTRGVFHASSCTGSDSSAICIAAGTGAKGAFDAPMLAVSINAGNTWAAKSMAGAPNHGEFHTASCTGSGASAICVCRSG